MPNTECYRWWHFNVFLMQSDGVFDLLHICFPVSDALWCQTCIIQLGVLLTNRNDGQHDQQTRIYHLTLTLTKMAMQTDSEGLMKQAERKQETGKEGRTCTCVDAHTGHSTIQIYVTIQWHGSWWQPLQWHPNSAGLQLCSLCVCTVSTHSSVCSSSHLSRLQMAAVPQRDAALWLWQTFPCVCVFACCYLCGWFDKPAKRLNYMPAANSPNKYAFTVDAHSCDIWALISVSGV